MNKMKDVFKQIMDRISKSIRYSPTEIERQIILAKIEAIGENIDQIISLLDERIKKLEEKIEQMKGKKNDKIPQKN